MDGAPNRVKTIVSRKVHTAGAVAFFIHCISTNLEKKSHTTSNQTFPRFDLGYGPKKSIETISHGLAHSLGFPQTGLVLMFGILDSLHTSQAKQNRLTSLLIFGQYHRSRIFANVFK